jgi:hypothetical protein
MFYTALSFTKNSSTFEALCNQFCRSTTNFMIPIIFKDKNFDVFDNSYVFHISFFDVKLPEDDLTRSKLVGVLMDLY